MKISTDWLKEYIDISISSQELADRLTQSGLEVEGLEEFETFPGGLEGIVIGEVLTCEKHPDADKLKVTTVDIGIDTPKPIVCGAPNVAQGQKVIVATVGATLYPKGHDPFKIKKAKIRGQVSEGMICAEDEIGLGSSHDGIMVLDTPLPNGTPAAEYFEVSNDEVIEIGLTPNRADATSHIGVAREVKVLLDQELKKPALAPLKKEADLPIQINVKDTEACPRYAGITISDVKVGDSPEWLQNRLKAIGLSPINNIVDITNYVLHEYGQPLHAFDYDKISSKNVVVQTLAASTKFTTLDETERKLFDNNLMICDGDTPMCIAGVFGGMDSGVKDNTTNVFLESAYFSPDSIRKTSQQHGLKTDASFRFERGIDPDMTVEALTRAANLICEIAEGKIASEITDLYPKKIDGFKVSAKYSNINKLIGVEIPKEEVKKILTNLEIQITSETEEELQLLVPPYRVDVQREADIIEEILRIYGYDKVDISHNLSAGYLASFPEKDKEKTIKTVSEVLVANGFNEIITNSLTKPAYSDLVEELNSEENVDILNRLSEDLGALRQSLLFSGLEVINHNVNRKQKNLKVFEFGHTYKKSGEKYKEAHHLALFMTGSKSDESWKSHNRDVNLHDLAEVIANLLAKLNITGVEITKSGTSEFSNGFEYIKNNKAIVKVGTIQKKILNATETKQEVLYADIDIDTIHKYYSNQLTYKGISKFPEVRRDLSVVLDKRTPFSQVDVIAKKFGNKLIKRVNVFDVYEGENLGKDKKSYSVEFILQDEGKTLNDKIIDKTMNKLISAFENELGALIRK